MEEFAKLMYFLAIFPQCHLYRKFVVALKTMLCSDLPAMAQTGYRN